MVSFVAAFDNGDGREALSARIPYFGVQSSGPRVPLVALVGSARRARCERAGFIWLDSAVSDELEDDRGGNADIDGVEEDDGEGSGCVSHRLTSC